MADAKHTPGPWRISWGRNGTYPLAVDNGSANVVTSFGRPSNPEARANAHLIAAAPELLDVLKTFVAGFRDHDEVIKLARAAIAKATGTGEQHA